MYFCHVNYFQNKNVVSQSCNKCSKGKHVPFLCRKTLARKRWHKLQEDMNFNFVFPNNKLIVSVNIFKLYNNF